MDQYRNSNYRKLIISTLVVCSLLIIFPSCSLPLQGYFSTSKDKTDTPNAVKVTFTGPQFSLAWDYTPESSGTYTVYVRQHGLTDWHVLLQDISGSPVLIDTSMLDYGEFDFAVSFTPADKVETELHTSLETTAIPQTGWYLSWEKAL